ncbi:N-alpha-acetyltransferase 30 [Trichomonascus vanleenenianus]|uniref:peptide alpha-N-acetyltransferase MAK3 n=1 Tax=Trichomonascus vanleenenianus TaxID=2268995 RepID=UPI003ECB0A2C
MDILYRTYDSTKEESELRIITKLVSDDLSEPYSIYVYRYFIYESPELCFLAFDGDIPVGVIVCNIQSHRQVRSRGYIAMLAVKKSHRGRGIAKRLITMAVEAIKAKGADEIILETEVTNTIAMRLYENMGFLRSKRLHRYYLNANDAFRLILPLKEASTVLSQFLIQDSHADVM